MSKKYFGVMLDCANGAVMKPEKVKEYMRYLKGFGYNMIQLYTEDAYEVIDEPYFGYMRGGYTMKELKDIAAYGDEIGVTVMPCLELFGHMARIFKWSEYASINDTGYILLADEERTYRLIENQIKTVKECFTCDTIHLGFDEVAGAGTGKYLKKHGYVKESEIFKKHLARVAGIAEKYGLKPLIWSDMIFQTVSGNLAYNNFDKNKINEAKDLAPEKVGVVYWEYFFYHPEKYEEIIDLHLQLDREVWFGGGIHTWTGFTTSNAMSVAAAKAAMTACRNKNINNIIMTLWGGGNTSFFAALPALCYARCVYEGVLDEEKIKERFKQVVGVDYDLMADLDAAETLAADYTALPEIGFSKYVVFQDVFNNFLDTRLENISVKKYLAKAEEFEKVKTAGNFKYLFDCQSRLLKLIYYKKELGVQLKERYQAGDKAGLKTLLAQMHTTIECFNEFYQAFKTQFYIENNERTFNDFALNFGGSIQKLSSCAERLEWYLNGKTDRIEELEKPLLPFKGTGKCWFNYTSLASLES